MFMAGNDGAARRKVRSLLEAFGWKRVIDLADIRNARWFEALSLIWVVHSHRIASQRIASQRNATQRNAKSHHAFKLIDG